MLFMLLIGIGVAINVLALIWLSRLLLSDGITNPWRSRRNRPRRKSSRDVTISHTPALDPIDEYWQAAAAAIPGASDGESSSIELSTTSNHPSTRPTTLEQIPGTEACLLALTYLQSELDRGLLPMGKCSLTRRQHLVDACERLKAREPSMVLSHGAIVESLGEHCVLLVEPLIRPVQRVEKAITSLEPVLADRIAIILTAATDAIPSERLAHLRPLTQHFNIPETQIYIQQEDFNFISYHEDINNFVPARIRVDLMPNRFFESMLNYATEAFQRGDYEVVLRVIAPMVSGIVHRSDQRDFSNRIAAETFNLVGMAYRMAHQDHLAADVFRLAVRLLKRSEDYESLKSVEANLGITLALLPNRDINTLTEASMHLQKVTELNPLDREAWLYLADTFMQRYAYTQHAGLLRNAYRAYERANCLEPSEAIVVCLEQLKLQQKHLRPNVPQNDKINAKQMRSHKFCLNRQNFGCSIIPSRAGSPSEERGEVALSGRVARGKPLAGGFGGSAPEK